MPDQPCLRRQRARALTYPAPPSASWSRYLDEIRARNVRIFYRGQRFENPVDPFEAAARALMAG